VLVTLWIWSVALEYFHLSANVCSAFLFIHWLPPLKEEDNAIIHTVSKRLKVKGTHLGALQRDLPYRIMQCYLLPDTGEHYHCLDPNEAGQYSIYVPQL